MVSKITMVMVSSINGYITNKKDPNIYTWTSREDSQIFLNMVKKSDLVIMGSRTYTAIKPKINLKSGPFRLVITRHPTNFQSDTVKGKLEFISKISVPIINKIKSNYQNILLVGGSEINTIFLKLKLVDELLLTIEPLLFGNGKQLLAQTNHLPNINGTLLDVKKINSKGTLFLRYQINYSS